MMYLLLIMLAGPLIGGLCGLAFDLHRNRRLNQKNQKTQTQTETDQC